jgi:hypothetical protein
LNQIAKCVKEIGKKQKRKKMKKKSEIGKRAGGTKSAQPCIQPTAQHRQTPKGYVPSLLSPTD